MLMTYSLILATSENGKFLLKLNQRVQFAFSVGEKIILRILKNYWILGLLIFTLLLLFLNHRPSILVSDIIWQCQESQPPTMSYQLLRRKEASPGGLSFFSLNCLFSYLLIELAITIVVGLENID